MPYSIPSCYQLWNSLTIYSIILFCAGNMCFWSQAALEKIFQVQHKLLHVFYYREYFDDNWHFHEKSLFEDWRCGLIYKPPSTFLLFKLNKLRIRMKQGILVIIGILVNTAVILCEKKWILWQIRFRWWIGW